MSNTPSNTPLIEAYASMRRAIGLIASQELKRLQIGPKQMQILYHLDRNGSSSLTDLAEATQSDPAATSRALKSLEHAAWIKRRPDPNDSRRSIVELAPKGKKRAAEIQQLRANLGLMMAKSLSKAEHDTLIRLLNKVTSSLKENRVRK